MYHIEIMNIVIIVTGGMVTVAYAVEYFIGLGILGRYEDFYIFISRCSYWEFTGGHSGR